MRNAAPERPINVRALGTATDGLITGSTMLQISTMDIELLDHLSRAELRELWQREFAVKAPPSLGRDILALGIAYVRQERRYGGLPKPVTRELDRLLSRVLRESDVCDNDTMPLPRAGTVLVREWRGVTHHVTIVEDGFLWNGTRHRSLSTIARAITGTNWNGPRFFGMRERGSKVAEKRNGR